MNIVLDSSVVAKWYLDEEQKQEALKLRDLHIENQITITVPVLLLFELGNIFITRGLNQRDFYGNFEKLLNFEINFPDADFLFLRVTFFIAKKYKLTFYDATYVALAQNLKCNFVTADQKLYQATKNLKFVKLLKTI